MVYPLIMITRLEVLLSWIGLPVYAWQGWNTRRNTLRMTPPEHDGWVTKLPQGTKATGKEPLKILLDAGLEDEIEELTKHHDEELDQLCEAIGPALDLLLS